MFETTDVTLTDKNFEVVNKISREIHRNTVRKVSEDVVSIGFDKHGDGAFTKITRSIFTKQNNIFCRYDHLSSFFLTFL